MSTSGMPTTVKHGSSFRERAGAYARATGRPHGRPPRRAYEHYFIESEGLHSRIHLQNFWSTFWPQVDEPATARIQAFDSDGTAPWAGSSACCRDSTRCSSSCATCSRSSAREPPRAPSRSTSSRHAGVRAEFGELPKPDSIEIKTPFWMAFYDDAENYMYVHSIEMLRGETLERPAIAQPSGRGTWPKASPGEAGGSSRSTT